MRHLVARLSATAVLFLGVLFALSTSVSAAIDASALGARYNGSNIDFKVFSSRATRIEVFIYKTPSGAQEVVRYVLTKNAMTQCVVEVGRGFHLAQHLWHHRDGLLRLPCLGPQLALRQHLEKGPEQWFWQRY
jgi:hypothetical protein